MSARAIGTLALSMLLGACFSEHVTVAAEVVSFSADVAPVLNGGCAFSGCHGTGSTVPAVKPMVLTAAQAYDQIVNVPAGQLPAMDRIEPGNPDGSYLIHKLQGTHTGVGGLGSRMPAGAGPLAPTVIAMMRQWVAEGALRN